jgi:hypothetical protein
MKVCSTEVSLPSHELRKPSKDSTLRPIATFHDRFGSRETGDVGCRASLSWRVY